MQNSASEQARRGGEFEKRGARATVGQPTEGEGRALRRSGFLQVASDLLWVPQAGLIAFALGALLTSELGMQGGEAAAGPLFLIVLACAAGIGWIAVFRAGLQYLAADIATGAAQSIQNRVRTRLLASAVAASPAEAFPSSGAFAAHVTEQVDQLGPFYRNYAPQLLRVKLVPLAIVAATAWFSWVAALVLVICGPLIPAFMALIGMKAKSASAVQQDELTRLSGVLLDRIRGLETLTLFGALKGTGRDIALAGETFRLGTMRVLRIAFLSSTVLELFSALGIAFSAVYVGFTLLGELSFGAWGQPFGYAGGLFVLLLAPEFFAPLRAYAAAYHDRAAGLAAQERLSQLQGEVGPAGRPDARPERGTPAGPAKCTGAPAIRFRSANLVLGGRRILSDFNLEIGPGETILLTGESGSGKSSLIDCVLGFRELDAGELCVGDPSQQRTGARFLQSVSWLGQAPRLFHGSLRANLLKGASCPEAVDEADLWAVLELAGAAELVERLPQGLATPLGEDGFGLSVGEIRRIALARAALRRDATLLLADEPAAALDEDTAADVLKGLASLARGKTTVIATHDAAVLKLPGRVVELGRPALAAAGA